MNDLFQEIGLSLDFADEFDLQQRRDERMKLCMKMAHIRELPSGGRKITYWRCKDPRCDNCNNYKGEQYRNRMLRVLEEGRTLYCTYLFGDAAKKLVRRLRKDNYLRLPQDNELSIIFFTMPEGKKSLAEEYFKEDVMELDWTDAVRSRGSSIISGNLGKEKEEEPDTGYILVEAEDMVAGPIQDVIQAIVRTSTGVIAWQDPEDVEENNRFRRHYNAELLKNLKLQGCRVLYTVEHTIYVPDLKINFFEFDRDEIPKK